MRLDFHVHAAASSKTGFDPEIFEQTLKLAKKRNLDVLVLTDHLHLHNWPDIITWLEDQFKYEKPCFHADEIELIPGMEITLDEGPHILVAGSRGHIRRLYNNLDKHHTRDTAPSLKDLLKSMQDLHLISAVAHPLKPGAELSRLHKSQRNRFDALEVNGNVVTKQNPEGISGLVHKLAARYKLSVIAGSDSHGPDNRLGSVATILPREFHSISDLHTMILARQNTLDLG